jgi:photosynthetic reaction center cytochrome c subunit
MNDWGLKYVFGALAIVVGIFVTLLIVLQSDRPPIHGEQTGFRGTAIDEITNPRTVAALRAENVLPAVLPPLPATGAPASKVYKNVQVLGDLSVGQFTRLMATITTWVAPKQGCAYCHDVKNMASDALYTKVVARRMVQMVQYINADWKQHVDGTGVTCYTCHRGQPVPARIWFDEPANVPGSGFAEALFDKNHPSAVVGDASLPNNPFTPYLEKSENIRVQATTALPVNDTQDIKDTEATYGLMMHISTSLGVNCTYCHNTRSFGDWSQSSPQRVTAWYGIRMVRSLNNDYLDKLHDVFPPYRLGALGDGPKLNCATCHQGVYKPLFGQSQLAGFPELQGPLKTP